MTAADGRNRMKQASKFFKTSRHRLLGLARVSLPMRRRKSLIVGMNMSQMVKPYSKKAGPAFLQMSDEGSCHSLAAWSMNPHISGIPSARVDLILKTVPKVMGQDFQHLRTHSLLKCLLAAEPHFHTVFHNLPVTNHRIS